MEDQQKFVAYYRVSTARQGESGLGLEAQRTAVAAYIKQCNGLMVCEFEETESAKHAEALEARPKLRSALSECKRAGATLLIAKLDRLARNVHFISGLIESKCDFVAADMPMANKVMLQMHAVMSEWERDQISARTKAALAAAKLRGTKLGVKGPENLRANIEERRDKAREFAAKMAPVIDALRSKGMSQRAMVKWLNTSGLAAPKGGPWSLIQLQRVTRCELRQPTPAPTTP